MEVTQLISLNKKAELTFGPNADFKSDLFRMSQLPVSCMPRVLICDGQSCFSEGIKAYSKESKSTCIPGTLHEEMEAMAW